MRLLRFAPFAFALATACATSPEAIPPIAVQSSQGEVRAYTAEDAGRVAALLEELAPKVRELLVETREGGPEVFVLEQQVANSPIAYNCDGRILLGPRSRDLERFALAHELAHWQVAGAWKALPPAVEEGLADGIALELVPEASFSIAVGYLSELHEGGVVDPVEVLHLTRRQWSDMPHGAERSARYAVGFFIAVRIGIPKLRALCAKAVLAGHERVPAEWLLAEARLPPTDIADWKLSLQGSVTSGASKLSVRLLTELPSHPSAPDESTD